MTNEEILEDVFLYRKKLILQRFGTKELSFYGMFLMQCDVFITEIVPTMGVMIKNKIEFLVNPKFWLDITEEKRVGILVHEALHIMLGHIFWGKQEHGFKNQKKLNYAMDLVINQIIHAWNEPKVSIEGGLLPKQFNLPLSKDSVWYYENLKDSDIKEEVNFFMLDEGERDTLLIESKILSNQIETRNDTLTNEQKEYLVSSIIEECKKSIGTLPQELDKLLYVKKLEPPVINWKKKLKCFFQGSKLKEFKSTKKRESKRFPDSPGKKPLLKGNSTLIIDTSGSISNEDLDEVLNELNYIYKESDVTIILCDTKVHSIFKYKGEKTFKIKGGGGTNLSPAIEYINNQSNSFTQRVIIFTDGYVESNPIKCKHKTVWLISTSGTDKINTKDEIIKITYNN